MTVRANEAAMRRDLQVQLWRMEQKIDLLLAGAPRDIGEFAPHDHGSVPTPPVSPAEFNVVTMDSISDCEEELGKLGGPPELHQKARSLAPAGWSGVVPGQTEEEHETPVIAKRPSRQRLGAGPKSSPSDKSLHKAVSVADWHSMISETSRVDRFLSRFKGQSWDRFWEHISEKVTESRKTRRYRLVRRDWFQAMVCFVIVLQAGFIGYGAHESFVVHTRGTSPAIWPDIVEVLFTAFFTMEIVVRMCCEKWAFPLGPEWKSNIFDLMLVLLTLGNIVLVGVMHGDFAGISVGRLLRLSRFVALMRLSRVMRQLPSLRIILMSILDSMSSLVWCFLFIFLFMYVFAVIVVYGVAEHLDLNNTIDEKLREDLLFWWGGVVRSLVTLFQSVSGGVDWWSPLNSLKTVNPWYEPLFILYIFLMCFGVLNVVVGTFVATTQQIAANDPEAAAKYAVWEIEGYIQRIQGFFDQADVDRTGTLSWDEFRKQLANPKTRAYFQALELDVSHAHVLFDLLDEDGSGYVTVEEFIEGCVRLRGKARSIDLNKMMQLCELRFEQMAGILESFSQQLPLRQPHEELQKLRQCTGLGLVGS